MKLFDDFGAYSGQLINAAKSKFYSSNIPLSRIVAIASLTGFNYGSLPFRYLGIPIFKGKPKASYLRPICDKIQSKLGAWKGKLLTIIGRVQLVNSVIGSMLVYSFHVYRWPKSILVHLSKLIRNFVWSGDCNQRKICTVSWHDMCKPREEGGLAIRDPFMVNQASLLHLTWNLLTSQDCWALLCRSRFLSAGKPKAYHFSSSVWIGMKQWVQFIYQYSTWNIGNGDNIHFWLDRWLERSIVDIWQVPENMHNSLTMLVSDYIVDGQWNLPDYFRVKDRALFDRIHLVTLPIEATADNLHWNAATDGHLTNKLAYSFLSAAGQHVNWHKIVWIAYVPPTRAFICWRFLHNRIPTDENLRKRGCQIVSICCFCRRQAETSNHIFLHCPITTQIWDWLSKGTDHVLDLASGQQLLLSGTAWGNKLVQNIMSSAILHGIWCIWLERNNRYFNNQQSHMGSLINCIIAEVKQSFDLVLFNTDDAMSDF